MDNDSSHNDLVSLFGLSDDDENNKSVFTIDFKISNDGYDDDLSFDFDENIFLKDEGLKEEGCSMNESNGILFSITILFSTINFEYIAVFYFIINIYHSEDENGDEALTEDIEEVNKILTDKDALIIK